jgi:hypothetical protein
MKHSDALNSGESAVPAETHRAFCNMKTLFALAYQ